MAQVPTVTKSAVRLKQPGLYSIELNMSLMNGEEVLLSKTFDEEFRTGDDINTKLTEMAQAFQEDMQKEIDKYNAEQDIFTHAKMDQMVTWLNANLTG